jgi:hypothetical protein
MSPNPKLVFLAILLASAPIAQPEAIDSISKDNLDQRMGVSDESAHERRLFPQLICADKAPYCALVKDFCSVRFCVGCSEEGSCGMLVFFTMLLL